MYVATDRWSVVSGQCGQSVAVLLMFTLPYSPSVSSVDMRRNGADAVSLRVLRYG